MTQLLALESAYRYRYGERFIPTIHPLDEMFLHIYVRHQNGNAMRAAMAYLRSGEAMLADLETILGDSGRHLPTVGSLLEFASGYGRFTRFLVCRLDPQRVVVSDIDPHAVHFATRTFGVGAFLSADRPHRLDHRGTYDVIFVASLFSHLPASSWADWLQRLHALLNAGGRLVFSTQGMHRMERLGEADRRLTVCEEEGHRFFPANETLGRLPLADYGTAYVSSAYVERVVTSRRLGRLTRFYPDKLYGYQDVYVLLKERPGDADSSEAPAATSASSATRSRSSSP